MSIRITSCGNLLMPFESPGIMYIRALSVFVVLLQQKCLFLRVKLDILSLYDWDFTICAKFTNNSWLI